MGARKLGGRAMRITKTCISTLYMDASQLVRRDVDLPGLEVLHDVWQQVQLSLEFRAREKQCRNMPCEECASGIACCAFLVGC